MLNVVQIDMCYSRSIVRSWRHNVLRDGPIWPLSGKTFAPELIHGKPPRLYISWTLSPIIFIVAGHAKCFVSSDAIEKEKQRLPEMLDDIAEELKPMPPKFPLSLSLVARED
jgi:hypothetical protein